ncbi:MAG: molybdate ABC transporter substrate-binding protein [Bryobacterales bacterium]|nr:molybdate ABC transporter substrate-binding protein [Bryobacterales bacterium]
MMPLLLAFQTLLVAAASDLAPIEPPLKAIFEHKNVRIRFVLGSSGQLASQIRHGAPYDVYLSANEAFVNDLREQKMLVETTRYATGRLALYGVDGLPALAGAEVRHIAVANPAHAPYGVVAREALEAAGLWRRLEGKIVLAENVRQTVQFVESGNADAALTAWSLVKGKPRAVKLPEFVIQAGGVVAASRNQQLGRRFLQYLRSAEGRKILAAAGFDPPVQ